MSMLLLHPNKIVKEPRGLASMAIPVEATCNRCKQHQIPAPRVEPCDTTCVCQSCITRAGGPAKVRSSKVNVDPENCLLRVKAKLFPCRGAAYKVVDMHNDKKEVFQVKGNGLFDAIGTPALVIQSELWQIDNKQSVYSADAAGKPETLLFKVACREVHPGARTHAQGALMNTALWTEGLKTAQGDAIEFNAKMSTRGMQGSIWLGKYGEGTLIARLLSPAVLKQFDDTDFGNDEYVVEIAPGVDVSLVLAMVLAYDQMEQAYE
eukprot:TRINITY_DN93384_c0_g1_i1.p1 TRINITY_DN93384_c0_g1~~TRINITY_DN93384_c0_g1_i1.p1  ORF type:complete len:272 (+),score=42.30 TRINITY_DN93384_c0_g1_i1:25-816(+)